MSNPNVEWACTVCRQVYVDPLTNIPPDHICSACRGTGRALSEGAVFAAALMATVAMMMDLRTKVN